MLTIKINTKKLLKLMKVARYTRQDLANEIWCCLNTAKKICLTWEVHKNSIERFYEVFPEM